MKILQLHTRYRQSGGEDAVVQAQSNLLRGAGHTVIEHHLENPPDAKGALLALARAPWNTAAADAVAAVVRAERPDVAHLHNWWYAMSPSVIDAVRDLGVPLVMTMHNFRLHCANAWVFRDGGPCTDCFGGSMLPGVRHACYQDSRLASAAVAGTIQLHRRRRTWDRVDQLVAVSHAQRDLLVAGGMDAEAIEVHPNPVADPGPRPAPPSASSDVLVVSRLSSEKGIEHLLAAWSDAPAGLRLVIVGDGPERAALEASAPAGVVFEGRRERAEVEARMLRARVLAFPTRTLETFGLVAVEAMAAGLAPMVPALGGLPEVVADGAGWVVGQGNVEDWRGMLAPLADDELVDRAGAAARSRYEDAFAPEVVLATTEATYRRLAPSADARR